MILFNNAVGFNATMIQVPLQYILSWHLLRIQCVLILSGGQPWAFCQGNTLHRVSKHINSSSSSSSSFTLFLLLKYLSSPQYPSLLSLLDIIGVISPDSVLGVCGAGSRFNCLLKLKIHSCCSNSAAEALRLASGSKHFCRKSMPRSLS